MSLRGALALAAAGVVAACASPGGGAGAGLSVKDQMKQVVEPASNTLFAVGGEVDPANGPDQPKTPDARWGEAAAAAGKLKGVATSLTAPGRGKDEPDFKRLAAQMATLADTAAKAAKAKDGAGLSQAANDLSDNCAACHTKYKPQTG